MRWWRGIAAGIVLALGITVGAGAITPAQGRHARALAQAAATRIAGEVVLPAGATQSATEPADAHQLTHPLFLFAYATSADDHAFYLTSATPDAVIATVKAHLPAGARQAGYVYGGGMSAVEYSVPAPGGWSPGRPDLGVAAVTMPGGRTAVRIDADVRYLAPHPPGALIPPGVHSVTITMAKWDGPVLLSRVITAHRAIQRLAALIDGLPLLAALPGEAFSCPAYGVAPIVTIVFRNAGGARLASTSEEADTPDVAGPCSSVTFTVGGHPEPSLLDGHTLLRRAGAIAGVRLVRRG